MISQSQTKLKTDSWQSTSWEEYLLAINNTTSEKARGYYYNGRMRLEMSPLSNPHSRDHFIVMVAIALFASIRGIDLDGHDNCTYRKTNSAEAQPDASFYVDTNAEIIPWETTIINLDLYPPPDLVIEVAYTSVADDKGEKRLLYESLGVREYWIIDVQAMQIIALEIANQGSRRIYQSQVLPGLDIALLEEALQRSRSQNHGKVSAWLLSRLKSE